MTNALVSAVANALLTFADNPTNDNAASMAEYFGKKFDEATDEKEKRVYTDAINLSAAITSAVLGQAGIKAVLVANFRHMTPEQKRDEIVHTLLDIGDIKFAFELHNIFEEMHGSAAVYYGLAKPN